MPSWYDRFGQEWAAQGLTDDPTYAQADAGWAFIGQAPPTVEQFNTMFQWSDDKDNWLYGQIANCIIGSGQTPSSSDLTQLWAAMKSLLRRKLDVDTAFYVDAINGNDVTGTGAMGAPWKTIQFAINWIVTYIDIAGRNCIVQLAPGTYGPFSHVQPVNGALIVQGDPLNPRAYLIKNNNGTAVSCSLSTLFLQGVAVEGSAGASSDPYRTTGIGLYAGQNGTIVYESIAFGPCTDSHVDIHAGYLWPWHTAATTYLIYGGSKTHILNQIGGNIWNMAMTITLTGNPAFSTAFYYAQTHAGIWSGSGTTYIGTATGKKYVASAGGFIFTNSELANIPGTIAGTADAASFALAL